MNEITIRIIPDQTGNTTGKVADAELQFTDGPLAGLKLIGFSIWERRNAPGKYNVTFPARQYSVNGERRSFALLRPTADTAQSDRIRDLIIDAYQRHQDNATAGTTNTTPPATPENTTKLDRLSAVTRGRNLWDK